MKLFVVALLFACQLQSCRMQSCSNYMLRLVGGRAYYEGRVEICVNGRWGTICDDFWDQADANVVCRQLGYSPKNAVAHHRAHYGRGTGQIFLDNVQCTGTELMLINCSHPPVGSHNCFHSEDAGVRCSTCVQGDLRLIGGGDLEGRVEVCLNGAWGTVCDDLWGTADANVVCKQLGYSRFNASAFSTAHFGRGSGQILLDDVRCTGSEDRLIDCRYDPNTGDCSHYEDASVRCKPKICSDGDLRLVGGSVSNEGRVEICFNETWGTVCDDHWDTSDATVVCRQLGLSIRNATSFSQARFGVGSGPIYLDNVACSGSELVLASCTYDSHTADCTHHEDAGVRCNLHCQDGEIRLAGNRRATEREGRVEVCFNDEWGTVCDDYWDDPDARVVCRQLGYSPNNATAHKWAAYGEGTGQIHLDDVRCSGSEEWLVNCSHTSTHNCLHFEDAGVRCKNKICSNGDLRLVGGQFQFEGRVEVCWNETWGTVCDGLWSLSDAKVACRQLGFANTAVTTFVNAHFGQGTGPILLDDLVCRGNESRLVDCRHDGVGRFDSCTHADDAGVRCRQLNCTNGDLRLVGGLSQYEGRVEVCWNETWGTVCDDYWSFQDARVVCRQLGYIRRFNTVQAFHRAHFGQGSGPILLDNLRCTGSETRLLNCSQNTIGQHNCQHYEDAGVRCGQCVEGSIRLVGGSSLYEGRVEICLSGRWGTVCDDGWDDRDAQVVCRQLRFPTQSAQALYNATYGQGTTPIVMGSVQCGGRETRLAGCTYQNARNLRSCSHSEDAGVHCLQSAPRRIRITAQSSTTLNISWAAPVGAQRYILSYNISCLGSGISWSNQTADNMTFSTIVTGLHPYTRYFCCVSAITSTAEGARACMSPRTPESAPTAAPQNVTGFPTGSRSLSLYWSPLPSQHRNGRIRYYRVNITDVSTNAVRQSRAYGPQLTVSSLRPYSTYRCTVAAVTVAQGPPSTPIRIQTYQDVPSGPPLGVTAVSSTPYSIILSWSLPRSIYRNGIITGYTMNVTAANSIIFHSSTTANSYTVGSLSPYTRYNCSVAAKTVNGTGPFSRIVLAWTQEASPSGPPLIVSRSPLNSTTLLLSWQPPLSQHRNGVIREYRVNITEVESGRHFQNTTTTTSITIPFLHPYYNYLCSIAAYTVGIGPFSSAVRVQMPEDVPSGPPRNLHGAVIAADSITLTWGLPLLEDQNGVITGYVVLVTQANSGQSYQVNSNTTNLNLTSLTPNSLHTFAVAAQTRRGRGPYSNSITLHTSTDVPTAPPQSFTVTVLGPRSLRLSWTPPPSDQQNGDILGYTVTIASVETGREEESNTTSTSYSASSLHPYYTYQCKVAAFTSVGLGPFSSVVSRRTRQAAPSGFPENFLAVATSPRSILLTWIPPLPQDRNGIITGYFINATLVETGEKLQHSSNSTSLTMNAHPYTTYLFIIAAGTIAGRGPFSTEVSIKTPESAPSHHPLNITEQVLGPTSFRLRWNPPPVEHHHGVIRSYNVNVTEIETGRKLRYSTQSTVIVIRDLHPFYLYNCTVTAVTVSEGPSSAIIGVRTEEAAPSAAPGNLQVTSINPYSLNLQWSPPPLEHRNGIIRRYDIVLSQLSSETRIERSTLTDSITVRGLKAYTTYRCKVAAYTTALGPFSSEVQNRTHEDVPSGPPQGLTATPTNARTLVLIWRPPAEENRNGLIRGYTVNVTGVLSGQTRQFETEETRLTVESLHPYYSYNCSVAARTIGLGPFTYNVTAEMPEASPSSAPRNVNATIISPTVANLSWDAPLRADQNGIIRHYHVNITEVETARQWTHISVTNTYLLNFLRPHYTYLYNIAAVTISTGPYTQLFNFTTPPDIPGTPTNFSATPINSTALELRWQPPPPEHRNGVITRYVINITGLSEARQEPYVLYTTKTNTVVGSLHPSYTYTCKVAAETKVGPGPFSITVAQLPEDIPSSPPQNLVVVAWSSTSLHLTWDAPPRENQNGLIRGYRIHVTELETGEVLSLFSTAASLTVPNLHPAYNYTCVVAAFTVGDGPTVTASIRLLEDVPSGPPQQFTAEINSSTAVVLRWNPPLRVEQNGIIVHYVIRVALEGGDIFETTTQFTTYLNNTLRPYSTYNFSVAAATGVGTGPFSPVITANTPEAAPRVAPNVGVNRRLNATSIEISWEPLSTVESLGVVTSYSVKYRPVERVARRNLDDTSTIVETSNTNIILNDLDPRYPYAVSVAAKTSAGIGNYSEEIIIGLFYNSPFRLHLSGAILCSSWLSYESSEKANIVSGYIAGELMAICNCALSAKYIANPDLICMENSTGGVIFQGRLISTEDMNSTEMVSRLERWARTKPIIVAKGVKLTVAGICSEHLRGLDCIMDNTPPTTPPTIPPTDNTTKILMTPTQDSNPTGIGAADSQLNVPVIGASAGGGVLLLIVAVVILIVVVLVLRRRRYKKSMHFETRNLGYVATSPAPHRDMRLKIFEWEPQANMATPQADLPQEKQCKWDMGAEGEDDEHIYDTIKEPFSLSEEKKLDGAGPCSYCTPVKLCGGETANHSQFKDEADNYMKLRLENSQLEAEPDNYTSLSPRDSQLHHGDSQLRPEAANYSQPRSKEANKTDIHTNLRPGDSQLETGAANYSQLGPEGANYSQLGPEDSQLEAEADDYSNLRAETANHSQLGAEGANYSQLDTTGMLRPQYINVRRSTAIPNAYAFLPNNSFIDPAASTSENVLASEQDEYVTMASPPSQ